MDQAYRIGQVKDVKVHHIFALSMILKPDDKWQTLTTIEGLIQQKQFVKLDFIAGSYGQKHTDHSQGGTTTDPGKDDAQRMYGSSRQAQPRDPTDPEMEALLAWQASHQDGSLSTPSAESSTTFKPYVKDEDWLIYD